MRGHASVGEILTQFQKVLTKSLVSAILVVILTSLGLIALELAIYMLAWYSSPQDSTYWPNARFHLISSATDPGLLVRALLGGAIAGSVALPSWRGVYMKLAVLLLVLPGFAIFTVVVSGGRIQAAAPWVAMLAVVSLLDACLIQLLNGRIDEGIRKLIKA